MLANKGLLLYMKCPLLKCVLYDLHDTLEISWKLLQIGKYYVDYIKYGVNHAKVASHTNKTLTVPLITIYFRWFIVISYQ